MTDKERLEFIKETHKIQGAKSNDFWGFVRDDVDFLIQQAEIAQDLKVYVGENSEKSAKLNLFLQERNKPEYLGLHVVDAAMKYIQELEDSK